ncbi:MAG TPA: helix-turn-helix transcriptional regulator [Acidobacteriota bacterium]|nr:helix-turn-helix transcriptional regulator [Acidobacteriota bacterium]HQK89291.1 helix-turn-helix transcriptional regulator [Acidobacteriota bacterium]
MAHPELPDKVRARILKYRKRKGLTQREFADATGIPLNMITKLENGRAPWTLERLEQISKAFHIPVHFWVAEEKDLGDDTGILRLVQSMPPERRRSLKGFLQAFKLADVKLLNLLIRLLREHGKE